MSEERLRDLLEQAVPDAPEVRADGVAERAAAVRRRQLVAGGAVLAVVATAVVGGIALRDGGEDGTQVAADVPTTPTGSTAPYDVPLCPVRLPELKDANRKIPDLRRVEAVRQCPDLFLEWDRGPDMSDDEAIDALSDDDALVQPDLLDKRVAEIEPFDSTRCAALDVLVTRESLMFVMDDGSTRLVAIPICSPVTVDGDEVDGGFVGYAFTEALDEQRSLLAYTRPYQGTPSCSGEGGPARPGREELVSAVFCSNWDSDPVVLDDEQLGLLRVAWDHPQPVDQHLNDASENECTEGGDGRAVLAGTDRSDVVRLYWSPCGPLVWSSWEPAGNVAIPITLEELGLP